VPYELNNDGTNWCPGWESNPHEEKSPEDFKSSASAIPPPGPWQYKVNESKELVQYWRWTSDARKIQWRRWMAKVVRIMLLQPVFESGYLILG
jgi:hypothetical protein